MASLAAFSSPKCELTLLDYAHLHLHISYTFRSALLMSLSKNHLGT